MLRAKATTHRLDHAALEPAPSRRARSACRNPVPVPLSVRLTDGYDARRVCRDLGIPYSLVNHDDALSADVGWRSPFFEEYLAGT